jgi:spermidine synthase
MKHSNKISEYLNSFFKEKVIDTFDSEVNPLLEVALINGRYQLNAGSVNYSFGPLHDAFRRYFKKDPPSINAGSKVLLLGLGAGSVANIIRNELELDCPITGVDIDPAVIEAARKHFALDKLSGLRVVISDAYAFAIECKETYDFIVLDIYIDDKVPVKFETLKFVRMLSKLLKPGGKVVFNKLQTSLADESGVLMLTRYFQTIFEKTEVVKILVNKDTPNCFITGVKSKNIQND